MYWKLLVGHEALVMPVCRGKERKTLSLPRKRVLDVAF